MGKAPTTKLQYRQYVTQRLAKHFGVKKEALVTSTEMEQDILYYPLLSDYNFHELIYAGHYDEVTLDGLWKGDKFIKGDVYNSLLHAQSQVPVKRISDVVVALHLGGGRIWFVYPEDYYEGLGGIFVTTDDGGYVIEPMEHYLKFKFPRPESD